MGALLSSKHGASPLSLLASSFFLYRRIMGIKNLQGMLKARKKSTVLKLKPTSNELISFTCKSSLFLHFVLHKIYCNTSKSLMNSDLHYLFSVHLFITLSLISYDDGDKCLVIFKTEGLEELMKQQRS